MVKLVIETTRSLSPLPLAGEVAVSAAGEGLAGITKSDRLCFGSSQVRGPLSRA